MPKRNLILTTGEVYHVFNKSVGREEIFSFKRSLHKCIEIAGFYRLPQKLRLSKFNTLSLSLKQEYLESMINVEELVEIYCYAFMPNHYHFLLKQLSENGISKFISNFQNSFAKYHNLKNSRAGALFLNPFKAKRIETDEQLLHVSRYIHLNPVTSYLIGFKDLTNYPWTSLPYFLQGEEVKTFVAKEFLLKMFETPNKYLDFISDQVDYQKELKRIKSLIIE